MNSPFGQDIRKLKHLLSKIGSLCYKLSAADHTPPRSRGEKTQTKPTETFCTEPETVPDLFTRIGRNPQDEYRVPLTVFLHDLPSPIIFKLPPLKLYTPNPRFASCLALTCLASSALRSPVLPHTVRPYHI
jgi:hypothetical protein